MFGMTLREAKQGFFDREKVKKSVDAATRRVLSRFGAFVRTRAKTSIRKRRGTSPPGQPPYSHVGLLRRLIFFAYDRPRDSVVIGPVLTRRDSQAPELLEHGGETVRRTDRRTRRLRYRPRPYMGPAFQREQQNLPALWRGSVR
jgi:hypothetical protein